MEPSDPRCPEDRLVGAAAGAQEAHDSSQVTLLEEQVGTSHSAHPLAIAQKSILFFLFFFPIRAAANYFNIRTPVLSSEKGNLGALFQFSIVPSESPNGANTI